MVFPKPVLYNQFMGSLSAYLDFRVAVFQSDSDVLFLGGRLHSSNFWHYNNKHEGYVKYDMLGPSC